MLRGIYAVLIADVQQSSARRNIRRILGEKLAAASRNHLRRRLIRLPYTVTAGDEFQTVVTSLAAIPAIVLDLRVWFQPLSLRIGIGIGRVSDRIRPPVNRLGGEAFRLARQAIDGIKRGRLFKFKSWTAFITRHPRFDVTMNLIYGLHDTLVRQITPKQWETIEISLNQGRLEQTARKLKLDLSTVSRNLKRGYYWQLSETVNIAGSLIKDTFL